MSTKLPALSGAVVGLVLSCSCRSAMTMIGMDDSTEVGKLQIDQLEAQGGALGTVPAWDAQAWYGGDYDKVWLKSEGSAAAGMSDTARNELLWDHVLTRWWDLQAGVRYDLGAGPARTWASIGVEGLAPYWFDVQAALYLGAVGRTAAHLQIEHDLLITQRWIVQPEIETDLYGRRDAARGLDSGLSDLQLALRVRYEIRRELAPYVGLVWRRESVAPHGDGLRWVAGLRTWF